MGFVDFEEMCQNVNGNHTNDTRRDGMTCSLPGGESITASGRSPQNIDKITLNLPVTLKKSQKYSTEALKYGTDATRISISTAEYGETGNIEIGKNGIRGNKEQTSPTLRSGCVIKTNFEYVILQGGALEAEIIMTIECSGQQDKSETLDIFRYHSDGYLPWLEDGKHNTPYKSAITP